MKKLLYLLLRARLLAPFANRIYKNISDQIFSKFKLDIKIESVTLAGIKSISIKKLEIRDTKRGYLLLIDNIILSFNIQQLFRKKIYVTKLVLTSANITITEINTLQSLGLNKVSLPNFTPYLKVIHEIFSYNLPEVLLSKIKCQTAEGNASVNLLNFNFKQNVFVLECELESANCREKLRAKGELTIRTNQYELVLETSVGDLFAAFFLKLEASQFKIGKIKANFSITVDSPDELDFIINVENFPAQTPFALYQPSSIYFIGRQSQDNITLYNGSFIQILNIKFFIQGNYLPSGLKLKAKLQNCNIAQLLSCFVDLKYHDLYKQNLSGSVSLFLTFTLKLYPSVTQNFKAKVVNNIHLRDNVCLNLNYLNHPFEHKIPEYDQGSKTIRLDNSDPDFIALPFISPHIKKVFIATEDRNFRIHNGFDQYYIGQSLAKNILKRKIIRGGSTITMQLARNLFLGHKRVLTRKIEEVFFTYLIEDVYKIKKDRIFEIYLNIIQFGPDIYGIAKATKFYFGKYPTETSLTEALVLSYIIPRPAFFLEALLEKSPQLISNLKTHMVAFSSSLLKRKLITEAEYTSIDFEIRFTPSLGMLKLQ